MKKQITFSQLKKLVKEGYSYWSHGDCFTGWDDMACAIEDKWGKQINDMTEDEKHKAYVDFALRDYGCNPATMEHHMVDYTKGAASRWASDLVWGKTSDWPTQLPTVDELVTRFEAYSRDGALRDFVDEVKEELEEHDLKAADMKGWLADEVKKNPEVMQYSKGLDVGSLEDYEKAGIERSFKDKFIDSIGAKMWKVYGGKEGIRKAFYSMGCYDVLGDDTFTDRENYYTHEKIPAETSPEQLCADWDNFVSQMGFDGAPEWAMELLYQRGYYKYYAAGNTSWSNPGGRNPKRTYANLKAAMSKVSAVAENSKITLTVGQLKRLVKESDWNRFVKQCDVEFMLTPEIKKAVEKYVMFQWKARNGEKDFLSAREIYDLVKFLKDKDILVGDDDVRIGEKKVAEIERNYSSHRRDLEYKELRPKVRWLGIDVDLKPIYPELEVKEGASMPKDKRFELLNALEQGQYSFKTLYQEVSNPSEAFDEIVKYEVKEIKESLAKFQQLLRSSKVEPMNEDEEGEPEKYIDDWLMPDQLTDDEFTDFTYFVDEYTGTEAYTNYEKKMPESLFNEVYDKWLTEWEKEHNQKPYKDLTGEDPYEGL